MAAVFPDDFYKRRHAICDELSFASGGENWQWLLHAPNGEALISVVGGVFPGLHGNGVDTFEMWDFSESSPRGYMTAEQINAHLQENNVGTRREE